VSSCTTKRLHFRSGFDTSSTLFPVPRRVYLPSAPQNSLLGVLEVGGFLNFGHTL